MLSYTIKESVWMRRFLNKLKRVVLIDTYTLCDDSNISIILIKNLESQARIKHINIQYYYILKLVTDNKLSIKWVCNINILANGYIKILIADKFRQHQGLLEISN